MKSKKYIIGGGVIAGMIALALTSILPSLAGANPLEFLPSQQSATATSSPTFMTPGTATSTGNALNIAPAGYYVLNTVAIAVQFTASSTGTFYGIRYEYANQTQDSSGAVIDCVATPTACDWYTAPQPNNSFNISTTATTSPFQISSQPVDIRWQFASSSQGAGDIKPTNNRAMRIFDVPLYGKYVRPVIYIPIGSANGAVWTQWVSKKEKN